MYVGWPDCCSNLLEIMETKTSYSPESHTTFPPHASPLPCDFVSGQRNTDAVLTEPTHHTSMNTSRSFSENIGGRVDSRNSDKTSSCSTAASAVGFILRALIAAAAFAIANV